MEAINPILNINNDALKDITTQKKKTNSVKTLLTISKNFTAHH